MTRAIESHQRIEIRREEIGEIDPQELTIVATGPLTSESLAASIGRITGSDRLFFYDSISPIVDADTVDKSIAFPASRYDKSLDGTGDYLNCPFSKAEYERFVDELIAAESVEAHIPDDVPYFEACLPIEEIARRGRDTLRFGPMKPMGLTDPRTGRRPWAAVQLRQENLRADSYNLVGFQNHLRFAEQKRIMRLIPGLENAEFLRYGQIHRNTYINAPALLDGTLALRAHPNVFFAGQISGVEGYVESIATGLVAGMAAAARVRGDAARVFPRETAIGSLCHYVSHADPRHYQPANIAFDLFPPLHPRTRAIARSGKRQCANWLSRNSTSLWRFMSERDSELAQAIEDFLGEQARRNDSEHTLRNYRADLIEFLAYFSPPGAEPPALAAIDLLSLREWLAHLYDREQKPATIRRKLASLRSLVPISLA